MIDMNRECEIQCGFALEINLFLALLRDFQLCGFKLEINLFLATVLRVVAFAFV